MDCLTFRRLKLATPSETNPEMIAHQHSCADCAGFARQADAFERELHDAAAVPVPDGLAEQIILRHRKPQWFSRTYLAMAATLVLSVAAVVSYNVVSERNDVAYELIAHVASEPEVFQQAGFVDAAQFEQTLSLFGAQMVGSIGEVRYLGDCVMDGVLTKHILVQTEHGTATLMLLPDKRITVSRPLTRDGLSVTVVPLGNGSLGIVTSSPERSTQVESLVRSQIRVRS